MRINDKGQEVYEGKPIALGVRGLDRPLSPREEMRRMILDYDNLRRQRAVRVDPVLEEDMLVRDPESEPELTDAEMEYQLSVAEAEARRKERYEAAAKKREQISPSPAIQDPPDPARPDPKKDPGPPTPGVQGKEGMPEKA